MLEYTVLTTFAFILAIFTLWTIRTAKTVGRKMYNAFLPSAKSNLKKPVTDEDLPTLSGELQFLSMPWGWRESPYRDNPVLLRPMVRKQATPAPWGWPGGNPGELRNTHPGKLQLLTDRIRDEASAVEIPFARNRNAVKVGQMRMLTYFDADDGALRFPQSESKKDRGFQLPWGW
ncbi:MAG: hypothetical protein HKO64_02020 [Xanthomonadales bacterium]|nr:hypothetical protein [Xanthomonadales bacterium]